MTAQKARNRTPQLQAELGKAQEQLETFRNELPDFRRLVDENKETEARLIRARASVEEVALAKNRTGAAAALLEQHLSDLEQAEAEVGRLEFELKREQKLETLTEHAKESRTHRDVLDETLILANEQLEGHVQTLLAAHDNLSASRQAFAAVGADEELLEELRGRGVSLAPIEHQAFPAPHGQRIWQGVVLTLLARQEEAQARLRAEASQRRETMAKAGQPVALHFFEAEKIAVTRLSHLMIGSQRFPATPTGGEAHTTIFIKHGDLEAAKDALKSHPETAAAYYRLDLDPRM